LEPAWVALSRPDRKRFLIHWFLTWAVLFGAIRAPDVISENPILLSLINWFPPSVQLLAAFAILPVWFILLCIAFVAGIAAPLALVASFAVDTPPYVNAIPEGSNY
jgi:hypothetical protein